MRPPSVQQRLNIWSKLYLFMVMFSLGGTVASRAGNIDPGIVAPVAAGMTLAFGCAALISAIAKRIGYRRAALAAGAVLSIGAAAEILGLYTAFPFGEYRYTREWEPVVGLPGEHFFPLLLPLAWLMMVGSAYLLAVRRFGPTGGILGGGVVAAISDWPMEPIMVRVLKYWEWERVGPLFGVPIQNALGWFLVASIAGMALKASESWEAAHAPEPILLLGAHLLFMASLAYLDGLWLPAWTCIFVFLLLVLAFPSRPGANIALVGPVE